MSKWRTASLLLIVVAAGALMWGYGQMRAKDQAERELAARYQQAFFEAVDHVENVEVLLSKGLVSTTPGQVTKIFADLRDQAAAAQASLTQLPLLQGTLMRTSKFLTQVADFGSVVAEKAAKGVPPDGESQSLAKRMKGEAALLSSSLHDIQQKAADGQMPWEEIRKESNRILRRDSKEVQKTGFTRIEDHFEQIPTIQYDGPFSDHVLQRQPKGLTGAKISESQAEEVAIRFVPVESKDAYVAKTIRRVEGDIPAFTVSVGRQGRENAEFVMDVSTKGGHVVWMLDNRSIGTAKVSMDQAVRRAKDFLVQNGFKNMVPTYATEADNRAVVPFVPELNGVLIYPDLIKVTTALDTGQVVGFEALGYLMSHTNRKIPEPKLTSRDVLERVRGQAEPMGDPRLALIPTENLDEVLTWEVPAERDGETYLVYINARNGDQERILRLVETGKGQTAI